MVKAAFLGQAVFELLSKGRGRLLAGSSARAEGDDRSDVEALI